MAKSPTLTDYADVIMELFTLFVQCRDDVQGPKRGRPFAFFEMAFILFFMMMQRSRIANFKAQRRWLDAHPDALETLTADDAYTKAMRIRRWFERGAALITPALKWKRGRYAREYQRFIRLPESVKRLRRRRASVDPLFDLIGKVAGADAAYRQIPIQGIDNVRSFLALAALSVQIAMVVNRRRGLPSRDISSMTAALT